MLSQTGWSLGRWREARPSRPTQPRRGLALFGCPRRLGGQVVIRTKACLAVVRRASMHNSSNMFFLSFAIAVASSFLVVDEGDPVAPVLPAPAVCYTTSWDMTARGLSTKRNPRWVCETQRGL